MALGACAWQCGAGAARLSGSRNLSSVQPEMHGALASFLVCKCLVRQRVSSSKCGDLSGIAKSRARNWASPKTLDRSCSWGPFPTASKDGHLETFLAASETWLWSSLVLRVGLPPSTGFSWLRLLQSRHHGNALYQTTAWALWCRALADPQRTVFSTLVYSQIHLALLRVALWCVVLEIGL